MNSRNFQRVYNYPVKKFLVSKIRLTIDKKVRLVLLYYRKNLRFVKKNDVLRDDAAKIKIIASSRTMRRATNKVKINKLKLARLDRHVLLNRGYTAKILAFRFALASYPRSIQRYLKAL